MSAIVPSYGGKVFTVIDNNSVIRDPDNLERSLRDSRGKKRIIPLMTQVRVTEVQTGANRNLYVRAEPTDGSLPRWMTGWTSATNLSGGMINELIGYQPNEWTLEPMGTNYTVTDSDAVVRQVSPPFNYVRPRTTIPMGTEVVVTARSEGEPAGKYVHVSHGTVKHGKPSPAEGIGVTAFSNLTPGWSPFFGTEEWTNQKGDNACWRKGKYIGAKVLADIVGTGGQVQRISLDLLPAYLELRDAAQASNIPISINSGFRTYAKQAALRRLYDRGRGNLAAKPGRSNHQHGQALDLSTRGFDGDPVYDWMKINAPKFGFLRTVSGEHWHWEYRPKEAPKLAKRGLFKLASVRK